MCAKIVQLLGQHEVDHHQKKVVILSQDSFYRVLTAEQKAKALKGQFNFDHPGESGFGGSQLTAPSEPRRADRCQHAERAP